MFLLRQRKRVKKDLHRRIAEAPAILMGPLLVVQRGSRTPTGPFVAKFYTYGIRGSGGWSPFTRLSRRSTGLLTTAH